MNNDHNQLTLDKATAQLWSRCERVARRGFYSKAWLRGWWKGFATALLSSAAAQVVVWMLF